MNSPIGTPAARPVRMPFSRVRSSSADGRPCTGPPPAARGGGGAGGAGWGPGWGSVLSGPDQGGDADHRGDEHADGEEIASHRAHAPLLAAAVGGSPRP